MSISTGAAPKLIIKTDGFCISKLVDRIKAKEGPAAAVNVISASVDLVQKATATYRDLFGQSDVGAHGTGRVSGLQPAAIPSGNTGLMYGLVQSGKTFATIGSLAIAAENGFRCFVVLTSDNTWLGRQTASRFKNSLEGGPVVFHWEEWHDDPDTFAKSRVQPYIGDTGVVLISTKNVHHLEGLRKVLKTSGAKLFPAIIFDDEADNASLNTSQAAQARKGKAAVDDSAIFEAIGEIRKTIPNHVYVQITATPQSLLLQGIDHPCKPAFATLPQPGAGYMGGELFFEQNSNHCYVVGPDEVGDLKSGKVMPGKSWTIPSGLRMALCCFFLGSAWKMRVSDKKDAKYSFLAHICHKKVNHENLGNVIHEFVMDLDKALRGKMTPADETKAKKWLGEAYNELKKTAPTVASLDELIDDLKHNLRNAIPEIINADNPNDEPQYRPGMNILIGGNRLGRGVTIEGLFVTYYGRDAKQKMMDTVHQHARMFGYREHLKDVTRLFVPQGILDDFKSIYQADKGMREAIGSDSSGNIHVKPVWIGRNLKATRSNVLNPAEIDAFTPGQQVFPPDPLWKSADIKKHTEALDELLAKFPLDDELIHQVPIDLLIELVSHTRSQHIPGYKWEDRRIAEALRVMKLDPIKLKNGYLNIRRGAGGAGLALTRPEPPAHGFASSNWVEKAKMNSKAPTLILMMQKGSKTQDWDNQRVYLPTLVMPASGFAISFNYS